MDDVRRSKSSPGQVRYNPAAVTKQGAKQTRNGGGCENLLNVGQGRLRAHKNHTQKSLGPLSHGSNPAYSLRNRKGCCDSVTPLQSGMLA